MSEKTHICLNCLETYSENGLLKCPRCGCEICPKCKDECITIEEYDRDAQIDHDDAAKEDGRLEI